MADRKRTVSIIIEGKNLADQALSTVGLSLGKIAIAAGAATAAAGAVALALAKVTKAAIEQENSDVRLAVALASIGENTEDARRSLGQLAGELEQSTKQSDEAIQDLMATLLQLGRVSLEQLPRVTKATLDLAAVTGTELPQAADLMAKAAQGNTASLARYGIVLDKTIPNSQKFAALLELLEKNMRGTAEALGQTFAGQLQGIGNDWDNFLQALGRSVIESKALRDVLGDVSKALQNGTQWVETHRETIDGWIRSLIRATLSMADLGVSALNVASALASIDLKVRQFTGSITGPSSYGEAVANLDRAIIELADKTAPAFRAELERLRATLDATEKSTSGAGKSASDFLIVMHRQGETSVKVAAQIKNFGKIVTETKKAVEAFGPEISELDQALQRLGIQTLPQVAETTALLDRAIQEFVAAIEAGALSPEEHDAILASLIEITKTVPTWTEQVRVLAGHTEQLRTLWEELGFTLRGAATDAALQFSDALIDAAFGAEVAWGKFFKFLLAQIAKAIARTAILQAIATAIGGHVAGNVAGQIAALTQGQHGGLVRGGRHGVDSVAALLMPGEIVLPESLAEDFRTVAAAARGQSTEPGAGPMRGGGNMSLFARIEPRRDREQEAIEIIENISRLVERKGYRLVASEVVA
jgi:hypothetical protein